ncbi:cell wall-binding repeat-containing protein [Bacillus litorisediminis]|uniref:cell wall-binding repeat-containing protein n=1 Tax=Bacillus litorisediminis TaxID=2922713 RepID=UPI0028BECEA5|nr:cell wall-binding repeat-containing protein [Bacillus litorisediminis]
MRVEGKNMYEVSANAAAEYAKYPVNDEPEKIDTVFLANGDDPSYSLSVTPLAKIHNAPILLTTRHHLPKSIMKQIRALKPTTVVLLGSPKVISPKIVKELRLLGIKEIKRINGNDPISLSEQAAKKIDENGQGFIDTAIIASSSSSENLITASAAAAVLQYPILLVEKDNIPNKIKTFIKNHPNYKRFIIIGNESSISKEVEDTIRSYNKEIQIDRISGKDVYEVSANSARYFGFGITNMAIVNGDGIDAVIGSSIVSKLGGTVLLTPPDKLHSSIKAYLDEQVAKSADMLQVYMIGDPSRISDQVYKQIRSYLK